MSPQRVGQERTEEPRVIPIASRFAAGRQAAGEPLRTGTRDWIAWACLILGILCGAGAFHFAMQAL